ncbi:MAG: aminotransferase class IV [Phycisphaeraceae bacterium]|nr:aminotransferase class IV [Phycisphaeraceae bacterium]
MTDTGQPTADEPRWAFVNGELVARSEARLDIQDRAAMFGDAVYEVIRYYSGTALALDDHRQRLERSLEAMRIEAPGVADRLTAATETLIERHGWADARAYWQVSRGAAPRRHRPVDNLTPTELVLLDPEPPLGQRTGPDAATAITLEDQRWHRCDIKSVMLAPATLAEMTARDAGVDTAIFCRGERVTESVSANVLAVIDGERVTPPADQWILPGITRSLILEVCREAGEPVVERVVTREELQAADEILLTGTTRHVTAVVELDGKPVGSGEVGPVAELVDRGLRELVVRRCGL